MKSYIHKNNFSTTMPFYPHTGIYEAQDLLLLILLSLCMPYSIALGF